MSEHRSAVKATAGGNVSTDRLKGKTAIVFGAGSSGPGWGNGKAAAVAYARNGAQVACVDLAEEFKQPKPPGLSRRRAGALSPWRPT